MQAIQINNYNKNSVQVALCDIAIPTVSENDILVKVKAAAVNPVDVLIVHGDVKFVTPYSFPLTMGNEMAGIVEKTGAKATRFNVGDRVFARLPLNRIGAFAEYVAVDENALAKVPEYLSDEEAAAIPLTALTAEQALDMLNLKKGDSLFVSGGSGSFGAMAIPLAASRGLKVSTSGGAKDMERVMALGASQYFDYRTTNYAEVLKDIDGAIDSIGDKELPRIFSIVKQGGTIVSLKGMPNGRFAKDFGLPLWKQWLLKLAGMKNDRLAKEKQQKYYFMFVTSNGEQLQRIASVLEAAKIRPEVGNVYSLEQATDALQEVAAGQKSGKVIIKP